MMFFLSDEMPFSSDVLLLIGAASGGKAIEDTATGNPLVFLTDLAKPLKSLLIPFTPQQEGTGDPSPENIRPILPWNGLTVFGDGKNLANMQYGYVPSIVNGRDTTQNGQRTDFIKINNSIDYVASFGTVNDNYVLFYDKDKTYIDAVGVNKNTPKRLNTFSQYSQAVFVKLRSDSMSTDPLAQLEVGSTATAYEPYHPITETDIVFPSPVYGGTLDVVSGVLTVTHEGLVSTWGQAKVDRKQSGYQQGRMFFTHDVPVSGQSGASAKNQKCNIAKYQWDDFNVTPHFYTGTLEGRNCAVILIPEDTPDETEIVVSAKLKTTYEVQLTPTQLTALIGDNTIWSDADGSMTAVYLKKG